MKFYQRSFPNIAVLVAISLNTLPVSAQFQPPESQRPPSPGVTKFGEPAQQAQQPALASPDSTPTQSVSPVDPIPPLVGIQRPWPSPNLNPGVPSAFVANWGDFYITGVAATAGSQRPDGDGSFVGGFGLGHATKAVAVEVNGGCGSFKDFCGNGGLASGSAAC